MGKLKQNSIRMVEVSAQYRSEIISKALEVEGWLDSIIAQRFSSGTDAIAPPSVDMLKAHYCLLEDSSMLTYSNKVEILRRIIHVDELMAKKERSNLITGLQHIGAIRNIVAHCQISRSTKDIIDFDGETVVFFSYSMEKCDINTKTTLISKEVIKDKIVIADNVLSSLRLLSKVI